MADRLFGYGGRAIPSFATPYLDGFYIFSLRSSAFLRASAIDFSHSLATAFLSWWAPSMIRHNYLGLLLLAISTLAAGFGWGMNIWGGWSESAYERLKKSGSTWFWLRLFKIEQSQRNCIRFLKIASAFGLFVVVPVVLFNIAHFVGTR